jgi:hypothetical protein
MLKRKTPSALLLALAISLPVAAQEPAPPAPPPPAVEEPPPAWDPGYGDRFLQTSSPLANDQGLFQVLFTHRFNQPVNEAGGNNLGGLDSGANIGIGIGYVPLDRLSLEVYRASSGGDYEFAAKYTFLKPTHELPLAVGLRAGMNWLTKYELDEKTGFFGQAIVAVTLGERFTFAAAPTYVSNTPLFTDVWNVPVMFQAKLGKGFYATGEYVFRNGDLPDSVGQWSFALEKSVWRHRFAVWIGNSAASTVDQIMAADYAGGVTDSNIRLGFNIVRQFEIGRKP